MDFPTDDPSAARPSPSANDEMSSHLTVLLFSLDDIFCINVSAGRSFEVLVQEKPYRTVLACKSTGAPESTAAGRTSPGSLPSMICLGIGENDL